jgi:hypothetical protein
MILGGQAELDGEIDLELRTLGREVSRSVISNRASLALP